MIKKYSTAELVGRKCDVIKLKNKPRNEVYLVLDNIRSVHNVGAIFRTADATRVKKIFLCGITPYPLRADLEKTVLGTIEHVPWEHTKSVKCKVKSLKQKRNSDHRP